MSHLFDPCEQILSIARYPVAGTVLLPQVMRANPRSWALGRVFVVHIDRYRVDMLQGT